MVYRCTLEEGFALSLVLKERVFGTQKWPIAFPQIPAHNLISEASQTELRQPFDFPNRISGSTSQIN